MPHLTHLIPILQATSGAPPVWLDESSVKRALGFDLAEMQRNGFDPSIVDEHQQFNKRVDDFLSHPLIGEYLRTLTPVNGYQASGISVGTLSDIRRTIAPEGSYEGRLFAAGYLPVAGSVGGNCVCFRATSGQVIWADHDGDYDDCDAAVISLSENIGSFLADLLAGRLEARLDKLD